MQAAKTVVLGEASEESDTEDVDEVHNQQLGAKSHQASSADSCHREPGKTYSGQQRDTNPKGKAGTFGSTLLRSIGSSNSTLAKLANYVPYNLLQSPYDPSGAERPSRTTDSRDINTNDSIDQISPLHRTLYAKNRQLQASLVHLYKHPHQAATRGLHSINQRLVHDQKLIQEADEAMLKLKREQRNLDVEIDKIAK